MNSTKPNETAFPIGMLPGEQGLTKREYFASMAMQGLLSNSSVMNTQITKTLMANLAIGSADALIEQLNKEKS